MCIHFITYEYSLYYNCYLQLSPYLSSTEEHGLSMNVDVALMLDCRNFYKKPPLQIVRDFVIVTDKLHDDFDEFVKTETKPDISILPAIELLQFWHVRKKISMSTISRYGKLYSATK